MGEFEEQVRRYWPTGDPLNQASQFLRSEQINVALRLCRMYLVDKVVMDDAQEKRAHAWQQLEREKQELAQRREVLVLGDQRLKELFIEARLILANLAGTDLDWATDGVPCLFCHASAEGTTITHAPGCALAHAREFMQRTGGVR